MSKNWTGGYYYLLNIIRAFGMMPERQRPHLVLFTENGEMPDLEDVKYDAISVLPLVKHRTRFECWLVRLRLLSHSYVPRYSKKTVRYVFPFNADYQFVCLSKLQRVYWLPDFQHKYLTQFFSADEIKGRDHQFQIITEKRNKLVLSSQAAKDDLIQFYPNYKSEVHVVPFATILPPFSHLSMDYLREKYGLPEVYFMSPNQFWAHKNHKVILEALNLLKQKGIKALVAFTGNENDYRNPDYLTSLKEFVRNNDLASMIKFLGFIDRSEQLQLMNHARAVIQPSLFEGWSTVVEDSKAINQNLILSDIKVHHEQCGDKATYFDPHSPTRLAAAMEDLMMREPERPIYQYEKQVVGFAEKLSKL